MATLNYTTKIAASRTISECNDLLVKHGVSKVSTRYSDGVAVGLEFTLPTPHGDREFIMPVQIGGVHLMLINDERAGKFAATKQRAGTYSSEEHAERVAWRIVRDWLEAQLALIAASMATLDQVMLPYLVVGESGKTLYDAYRENEQRAIGAGS